MNQVRTTNVTTRRARNDSGPVIEVVGNELSINGARVRALLDALDPLADEATLRAQFNVTMARIERQDRWRSWGRRLAQRLTALVRRDVGA